MKKEYRKHCSTMEGAWQKMASPTIRMLWGIAKSPELGMTDEELHLLVLSHTGKDSIKQLNKRMEGAYYPAYSNMSKTKISMNTVSNASEGRNAWRN